MTHIFGCWTLDPEQPALVNTSTGEQLSFRESGLIDRPHEALGWIRFDYRHSDLRYAVFVKCVMSSNESLTWTIDHVRSASVWREETNAADAFPPYGAWRRVDDCVTDALVSWWHSRAAEGPRFKHVTAQGGWLNGQWKPDFARHLGRLSRNQNPKPEPASTTTLRSWIMPLTEPPPSPWSFRDVPDDWRLKEATPRRSFLDRNPFDLHFPLRGLADLRHAGDRYPKVPELSLPATVSLSAWEGEMACLLAQDGKRVLYPCWAEVPGTCSQNLAETHIPLAKLLYADDDLVCILEASLYYHWGARTACSRFGRRSQSVDPALRLISVPTPGPGDHHKHVPTYPLWLRIRWALIEGMLNWRGTRVRHPDWDARLQLFACNRIRLSGTYRAGLWDFGGDETANRLSYPKSELADQSA